MKKINLIVGNDNGNSEQDIVINEDIICQPNVHISTNRLPNLEETSPEFVAKNIHDNLIVTIESNSLKDGVPSTYYVGNYATKTGGNLRNIRVGAINSKLDSDIPLVNTLAHLGGYAASKAYLEDSKVNNIEVTVEMATALPVNQYSNKTAQSFADKFLNNSHLITVYLGEKKVKVNLKFTYVKVIPEGVPTIFYLQSLKEGSKEFDNILGEFLNRYNINETANLFKNKKVLHVSVGEGTTENPLTEDIKFNPHFITGTNNGVGHAINVVLEEFIHDKRLVKFSRQDFSAALKDKKNKYHFDAVEYIQSDLEDQAIIINDIAEREISRANNDIDYICVYGGGSILMKDYLKESLENFADQVDIKVLYIPEPYAVTIEALGMFEFAKSNIFKMLKKMYVEKQVG